MARVVVIGGGVAGLGCALWLARAGVEVTVVERDPLPDHPDVEAAFASPRRGVAQLRHSHAFLARLRNLLRDRAPDVLAGLLAAGATELRFTENMPPGIEDRAARAGDTDLVALACRRATFDWVLLRAARASGADIRDATAATGLVLEHLPTGPPRVRGVHVSGPGGDTTLSAGIVVDAAGNRSAVSRWLVDAGAAEPPARSEDCGIVYLSRFWRLYDGGTPRIDGPIGGDLGYLKYGVFVADNATFSVTLAVPTEDAELRGLLRSSRGFDAAATALQHTAPWMVPGRAAPLTDVAVMAGLRSVHRHLVRDGAPLALGLCSIGDSAVRTNPLYGRGCSLALVQAAAVADIVAAGTPVEALTGAVEDVTDAEVAPWFEASVEQDRMSRAAREGEQAATVYESILTDGLLPAVRSDATVFRAFLRGFNLLDPPSTLLADPDLMARVTATWNARGERPPEPPLGPPRDELLGMVRSA